MGKQSKDKRDIYYRLAKEEGYRARSAYKLLQIDEQFGIFNESVTKAVDLCAAPGSWSQVLSNKLVLERQQSNTSINDVQIVAVDLQDMAHIPHVTVLKGDITQEQTAQKIIAHFEGTKADLVISDGAPDVTGLHDLDEYVQHQLVISALSLALAVLKDGGTFIAKIFRGRDITLLYTQLKIFFERVHCVKPRSSRGSSIEAFVVCQELQMPEGYLHSIQNFSFQSNYYDQHQAEDLGDSAKLNKLIGPFMACGDLNGFDSDKTYPLEGFNGREYSYIEPIQKPISAPYLQACLTEDKIEPSSKQS
ncbi:hypothetical protein MP228_003645 [Amoeboaphelidium protococcarum]|nr:hypothetical protein MP228_003645 [Amoeboaphelidium protococcarum]